MAGTFYVRYCKRGFDLVLATLSLLTLSPLIALVAICARIKFGHAFFRQERAGWHSRPFKLIKIVSMTDECDADGKLLPDAQRLTKFGRFLRSSSLDELPELYNVVMGDMSLVGPRPLHTRYLARYSPEQLRRHDGRPGITGWAQVNGRNNLSWEEKFAFDVWYVDHQSLRLDLKIIFLTFWKLVQREGIDQGQEETMQEFLGTGNLKSDPPVSS
jgi:sugar transferase EpsL